jgi:hypothetical protein
MSNEQTANGKRQTGGGRSNGQWSNGQGDESKAVSPLDGSKSGSTEIKPAIGRLGEALGGKQQKQLGMGNEQ